MAYNLGPGESIPGELYFNYGGGLFQTTEGYYYEYDSGDFSYYGPYYYGQFVDYGYGGEGGYIGFLLGGFFPESDDPGTQQNGQYGWIRVSVAEDFDSITIHDWAYQDDGSPITVGDQVPVPSTLLLLATGAAGLAGLRRKKKNA
jgi:hypothetical protein